MKPNFFTPWLIFLPFVTQAGDLGLSEIDVTAPKGIYQSEFSSTATKTNTSIMDVPQTVNVINQKQLQDQQATDLGKAITYVPGVDLDQGEGNRDAFIIRGNKTTADIFMDGIKDDAEYYRDLYNIEKIDVLMGANGILFGKGGGGGIINRVSKQAMFEDFNRATIQLGSFDSKRTTFDINQTITDRLAMRINIMGEKSDAFVSGVEYEKQAINPVFTFLLDDKTTLKFGREYFHDQRIGYRGIPSQNGRPYNSNRDQYFGFASKSPNEVSVNSSFFSIEHNFSDAVSIKNTTRFTDYDKYYSNVYADGAVSNDTLKLSAYYDDTQRQNFFNQTDVVWNFDTAGINHTLLTGFEIGNQQNRRYRLTSASQNGVSVHSPYGSGWAYNTYSRDKRADIRSNSVYIQDQIKFNEKHQVVLGMRHDAYETDFNLVADNGVLVGDKFKINDDMLSTRLGYIYKSDTNISYYASYSNSFQPRNGDQLDAVTSSNANEDPEKFINYEVGAKWQLNNNLFASLAFYQLERERMQITDPSNSSNNIFVDGQRTRGMEININGRVTNKYSVVGGINLTDAEITKEQGTGDNLISKGTALGNVANVSFSLWNLYDIDDRWSLALGAIGRGEMYAATPTATTSVTIPGWIRFDAGAYAKIDDKTKLQFNIENILDKTYYSAAHNVNNIMVGMPVNAKATLIRDF